MLNLDGGRSKKVRFGRWNQRSGGQGGPTPPGLCQPDMFR